MARDITARPVNAAQLQRLANIKAWGIRDAREARGVQFNVPVFLQDYREKAAYVAGFLQETRRMVAAAKGGLS